LLINNIRASSDPLEVLKHIAFEFAVNNSISIAARASVVTLYGEGRRSVRLLVGYISASYIIGSMGEIMDFHITLSTDWVRSMPGEDETFLPRNSRFLVTGALIGITGGLKGR